MLRVSRGNVEVAILVGVYLLFLGVGIFSGQTTFTVENLNPLDGAELNSSPVELVARVTLRGAPVSNLTTPFTIRERAPGSEVKLDAITDKDGVAKIVVPAPSGNYSWHIATVKEGYPRIASRATSFTLNLTLSVDTVLPSSRAVSSPVLFKARVTDIKRQIVESAYVIFYVDSIKAGSSLTNEYGLAEFSTTINLGLHTWFASANKAGEGGISMPTTFFVQQTQASGSRDSGVAQLPLSHTDSSDEFLEDPVMLVTAREQESDPKIFLY